MNIKNIKKWNVLDVFVVMLVITAIMTFYFTFIQPNTFSQNIKREGVFRYAEVEILLPEDLEWLEEVIEVGRKKTDIFKRLEWEILGFEKVALGSEVLKKIRVKLLIVEKTSGPLRYGKYTLVKGSKIYIVGEETFIEGRVFGYTLLDETMLM